MTRMSLKTTTAAALGSLMLLTAAPAFATDFAGPSGEPVSVAIDRTMLRTDAGIAATYERLSDAADTACADHNARTVADRRMVSECRDDLIADFVESAAHDGLSDYHATSPR